MRTKAQFAQALRSSAEAGFPIILNIMTCCKGCTTDEDVVKAYNKQSTEFDLPSMAFREGMPNAVWHFGGQGNEIVFPHSGIAQTLEEEECSCYEEEDEYEEDEEGNETLLREGDFIECSTCRDGRKTEEMDEMVLNHSSDEAAEAAIKALREAGFAAEWDGSRMTCISAR